MVVDKLLVCFQDFQSSLPVKFDVRMSKNISPLKEIQTCRKYAY